MSTQTPPSGNSQRDQVIAGEYVLGVLSAEDRRKVEARIVLDRTFAAKVDHWQSNLISFETAYEPVTPPPHVFTSVERRLFADATTAARPRGLWNSLALWRTVGLGGLAAVVAVAYVNGGAMLPTSVEQPLVAELSGEGNAVSLVARYDASSGRLKVTPVASTNEQAKSLQLWLVEGSNAPVSLGVLPQSGEGEVVIPVGLREKLAPGATLAISVEPLGGSPTGQATGPVIALGKTRHL